MFNELLRHYIEIEYYGNSLVRSTLKILDGTDKTCQDLLYSYKGIVTKKQYRTVMKEIEQFCNDSGLELKDVLQSESKGLIETHAKFLSKLYSSKLTIPKSLVNQVQFKPFNQYDSIETYPKSLFSKLSKTYDNSVRSGYVMGSSTNDIIKATRPRYNAIQRGIESDVSTMATGITRNTDDVLYKDFAKNFIYCAILDGRTCVVCGDNNGLRFTDLSKAPLPPLHNRCRCFLVPEIDGMEVDTRPFGKWIAEQPEETQLQILGKKRFELYQNGMSVDQFVNDGRKLRLDELI